jgi:hypothetical protein
MKQFYKALLIFLCCSASLKAFSSSEFKEGYVITLKGDTTKGFILSQESKSASVQCVFKTEANSSTTTYKPGEISGYRYSDGKYYISKEISIDSTTKKVVFLEFLIKGKANVYYYVDNEEHYYVEKGSNLMELTEPIETYTKDGHTYITPSKYKGKLMYELQDCPEIGNEIQNTRLNHKSLIKLMKDYHEKVCTTESCIIYEKNNLSPKLKFGVIVGASKNMYDFGGQINTNYGNSFQIGAGLKMTNIFMFNSHLNLKAKLLFEKDSKSYTVSLEDGIHNYPVTYNNVNYILNDVNYGGGASIPYLPSMKVDLSVIDLKIPISLNYDFNLSKSTVYTLGIGISNKVILSQNKKFQIDQFYSRYGRSINSLLTGLNVTTGVEGNWFGNHTFFASFDYEYLTDFKSRQDNTLKLNNTQLSVQVGMYF